MAPTLVDISQDVTNKVRILNPFNKKVTISQDTIIGEAEKLVNEFGFLQVNILLSISGTSLANVVELFHFYLHLPFLSLKYS
jgi:hypothetical protein